MLVAVTGNEFHASDRSQDGKLFFFVGALVASGVPSGGTITVTASLPHVARAATTTGDYWVYFDGIGSEPSHGIACYLSIRDAQGASLFSAMRFAPFTTGSWETSIQVPSASVPEWAYIEGECILPGAPNYNVGLYGMELGGG